MDTSSRQKGSDRQQQSSVLAALQIIVSIIEWLAGFVQLTEEEQENAGIHLYKDRDESNNSIKV